MSNAAESNLAVPEYHFGKHLQIKINTLLSKLELALKVG